MKKLFLIITRTIKIIGENIKKMILSYITYKKALNKLWAISGYSKFTRTDRKLNVIERVILLIKYWKYKRVIWELRYWIAFFGYNNQNITDEVIINGLENLGKAVMNMGITCEEATKAMETMRTMYKENPELLKEK